MAIDLQSIEETPHLLDIMLEVEDVLDSLDIYVFKNWFLGEVVDGPRIKRYWVEITLQYPKAMMPDPRAGLRLLKHGIMVSFTKGQLAAVKDTPVEPVWLVKVEIPRKLLTGISNSTTDYYDDEIDVDDIESAKDMGVDAETGYEHDGK